MTSIATFKRRMKKVRETRAWLEDLRWLIEMGFYSTGPERGSAAYGYADEDKLLRYIDYCIRHAGPRTRLPEVSQW